MTDIKPDEKPAIKVAVECGAEDRGETVNQMEPLLIGETSRHRGELTDLAFELVHRATGLHRGLPEGITESLSGLVRAMNCYYSNLIEGHDTHLADIERALKNDYSADTAKRNLQLEAKAHITVQKWIDEGGLKCGATAVARPAGKPLPVRGTASPGTAPGGKSGYWRGCQCCSWRTAQSRCPRRPPCSRQPRGSAPFYEAV